MSIKNLTEEQYNQIYVYYWEKADFDHDGVIGQSDASKFFGTSGLRPDALANIWSQVNPQGHPCLQPTQFISACQLIGLAQNGHPPNLVTLGQMTGSGQLPPVPNFQINIEHLINAPPGIPSPTVINGFSWVVTPDVATASQQHFLTLADSSGHVNSQRGYAFFTQSGLPTAMLAQVWELSDVSKDGQLDSREFCLAFFLVRAITSGQALQQPLPPSLIHSVYGTLPTAPVKVPIQPGAATPPASAFGTNVFGTPAPASPFSAGGHTPTVSGSQPSPIHFTNSGVKPPNPTSAVDEWIPTTEELTKDRNTFGQYSRDGVISGESLGTIFGESGLPQSEIITICQMSDLDQDQKFTQTEFMVAMKIIRRRRQGAPIPSTVPAALRSFAEATSSGGSKPAPAPVATPPAPASQSLPPPPVMPKECNHEAELQSQRSEIQNLKSKLADAETTIMQISDQKIIFQRDLSQAQQHIAQLDSQILDLQAKLNHANTELAKFEGRPSLGGLPLPPDVDVDNPFLCL